MWSFQVWSWFAYSHNCVMYTHKTGMNIRVSDPRRTRYLPTRLCACGYTMCDKYTAHMVDCTCTIRTCTRRAGTTLCMRARHRLRSACRGCRGCRRPLMSCPAPLAACSAQPSSYQAFAFVTPHTHGRGPHVYTVPARVRSFAFSVRRRTPAC